MDIALTVGGSFLSPFLQVLLDRMTKPEFLSLFRKQKFDDRILKTLKRKLWILQAVLEDAETKQSKDGAVRAWLDELQEIVYQADDLLDQINTEALRVKVESKYPSPTNQVSTSADPSNSSIEFLREIMPKLEEIVQKLEDFEQEIGILGLIKEVEWKKQPFQLPSTSLVDENDVYGRDADKDKIIEALFSDDVASRENVSVISIVGLGGVGKTTLVQSVYNEERVNNAQFDTKAWVCISEDFDPIRITKELLNELNIEFNANGTFNSLQIKLKQGLSMKKFFLVLDDVWNRDYDRWSKLSTPFSGGTEGSKIIVTTRDENVALMMGSKHIHHLNPMSDKDCWPLFEKHAFNNRDADSEFVSIGKEIVKKCGGLPLAVKAIACLLKSKKDIEKWNEILRSDEWDQPGNILPSLRLSYTHLPSHLKRCFAYSAVFHKDYWFSKDEVILLWMANDLLKSPRSSQRLEDIGDEFFCELKLRSLFLQSSNGKFCMHDLVNDLAKVVSRKYFVRLEDHQQEDGSLIVARHFSYISSYADISEKFKLLSESKLLRTFLSLAYNQNRNVRPETRLSQKFLLDVLPAFESLRVLSLSGYRITELPNSFANLKQLRFLDLSCTRIKKLPSWICTFYNLQTLLLAYCEYLKEFPEDMEKLINLRHLDVSGAPLTKMPMGIGRLENLQFLSTFIVSKCGGSGIEELGKLCNLRGELTISGLENVANCENASMAKMKGKKYIKRLTLKWSGVGNSSRLVLDVFERLQPHPNIEHLEIDGYCGTIFPNWLGYPSFCHMISLSISDCENCFGLPAIGQLPSLKHLTISGLSKVMEIGQEFYGDNCVVQPFPCLKKLRIERMREWTKWHIPENGVFFCLEKLEIFNCPKFIGEIPNQLHCLKKLTIENIGEWREWHIPENRVFSGLEVLSIRSCHKFIGEIPKQLPCLKSLNIKDMREWRKWQIPENGGFSCLEELSIFDCPKLIGKIPKQLPSLRELIIWKCPGLVNSEGGLTTFDSRVDFSSLRELQFGRMPNLKQLSSSSSLDLNILLPRLEMLYLYECEDIVSFPINRLPTTLKQLVITNCGNLELEETRDQMTHVSIEEIVIIGATDSIQNLPLSSFPALQHLQINKVSGIEELSITQGGNQQNILTSLQSLWIGFCDNFMSFPVGGLPAPYLTDMGLIILSKLKSLPERMHTLLPSLQNLSLKDCPEIECFPEGGLPSSLRSFTIGGNCERLWSCRREWGLQRLLSLEDFKLEGTYEEETFPPEDLLLPSTLKSLFLCRHKNVKMLNYGVLQHLACLQSLSIYDCPGLQSLPEEGLPASLSKLTISDCPLLKQRLELEKGEDWPKAAHIRHIEVDYELIS